MLLVNNDLEKIKEYIMQESVKDSSFDNILLTENNISNIYIPVVIQNGNEWENKKISLSDLLNQTHILTLNKVFKSAQEIWTRVQQLDICDNENYNFIVTKCESNDKLRTVIIEQSFIRLNYNQKIVNQTYCEMTEFKETGSAVYRVKKYRRQLNIDEQKNVSIINGVQDIISEDIKTINNKSLIGNGNITIDSSGTVL